MWTLYWRYPQLLWDYAFITRRGPLGELDLLFNRSGIIIGQVILILPVVISMSATAIESLDERLRSTLLTLGARGKRIIISTLYESRFALMTAAAAAYGRAISEVGVSMMVGGNIKGYSRVLTTATVMETSRGNFDVAIALGIILLLFAYLINLILTHVQQKERPR